MYNFQHISAPLMEYERLKLIRQFTTTPPAQADEGESEGTPVPNATTKGEETTAPVLVDYQLVDM